METAAILSLAFLGQWTKSIKFYCFECQCGCKCIRMIWYDTSLVFAVFIIFYYQEHFSKQYYEPKTCFHIFITQQKVDDLRK